MLFRSKDNTIVSELSIERQAKVDAIRKELEEQGKDRFEIQEALMPYLQQLPKKYQGRNERLEERFNEQ